ncbi:hypothetical protein GCM10027167_27650 [Nocardia heshunensis]
MQGGIAGFVEHHTPGAAVIVLEDVHHGPSEGRLHEIGCGHQQGARANYLVLMPEFASRTVTVFLCACHYAIIALRQANCVA